MLSTFMNNMSTIKYELQAVFTSDKNVFLADTVVERLLLDKIMTILDNSGKRLWACTVCDYTRKLKNDVVKHVERRHLDLKLNCIICQSSFNSRNDLKLHMSGHQMGQ